MFDQRGSFIWYELMTSDIDGAKRFYDAVVGWDIEPQPAMPGMEYRMIRRSDGGNAGGAMQLSKEMTAGGARPSWVGYLAVADVDVTVSAIERAGGRTLMPATDLNGVGRLAMITDPQGAPLYVMRPSPPPDAPPDAKSDVFSVDQPQHVRWNELWSDDPAASIDFYTRHFGWVQEGDMEMGEMGKYQFLHHDGVMIGAVMPKMPDIPLSMWNFYIGVDDIDRATAAVRSNGGQVFQEPIQVPGGEYSINTSDPQGAMIGFVGPRQA